MSNHKIKIDMLREKNRDIEKGGGESKVERQHARGKFTARERISLLLDEGSFTETDKFVTHRCTNFDMPNTKTPGEGVVTGYGTIDGRLVFVYAQDFTVLGGSLGEMHAKKICKVQDMAIKMGAPLIGINDSGGARIHEGIDGLGGFGEIFYRNTLASGVVPQISVIMGPCAGGAVYSPALTDFVFMVENTSQMFITGPQVIKAVTGEDVSGEKLGGADTHFKISGVAHFKALDEENCIRQIKSLLKYLPSNNMEDPLYIETGDHPGRMEEELLDVIPEDPTRTYDMKKLISLVLDKGEILEIQKEYAKNIITAFARLNGRAVGVIANQPKFMAGSLDINASDKAARFIRFCNAFNFPLITFVDVPGFLPGVNQEHGGIIRHGAKLLHAYSEATVPKMTVITRKAYGGAYIAMCSKHLGADQVFAWPTAEIAVMGPEGAANIIFRKEMEQAHDPTAVRNKKIEEYREMFTNPYIAAERGYVDAVIEPQETRPYLSNSLEMLVSKRDSRPPKKLGNIPL